jgi:hypothetical protein
MTNLLVCASVVLTKGEIPESFDLGQVAFFDRAAIGMGKSRINVSGDFRENLAKSPSPSPFTRFSETVICAAEKRAGLGIGGGSDR